jgi:hypothetical protein
MGRGQQRRDRLHPDEFVLVNRVEAQFTALRYFALDGTDHASHEEQADRRPGSLGRKARATPEVCRSAGVEAPELMGEVTGEVSGRRRAAAAVSRTTSR